MERLIKPAIMAGEKSQLYSVRDKEKREVDFLTLVDGQIHELVEAKPLIGFRGKASLSSSPFTIQF